MERSPPLAASFKVLFFFLIPFPFSLAGFLVSFQVPSRLQALRYTLTCHLSVDIIFTFIYPSPTSDPPTHATIINRSGEVIIDQTSGEYQWQSLNHEIDLPMRAMGEHSSDDIQRPDTGAHCVRGLFDYRYDSTASFFAFFSYNLLYSNDNFTDCRFHFQCSYKKTRRQIRHLTLKAFRATVRRRNREKIEVQQFCISSAYPQYTLSSSSMLLFALISFYFERTNTGCVFLS